MKRFRTKKTKKIYLYLVLFFLTFLSVIFIFKDNIKNKNNLLNLFLNETTKNSNSLVSNIKEKLSSPKYMIYNTLNKTIDKNELSVFSYDIIDNFNYNENKSEYVDDPNPIHIDKPIVYLYNPVCFPNISPFVFTIFPSLGFILEFSSKNLL